MGEVQEEKRGKKWEEERAEAALRKPSRARRAAGMTSSQPRTSPKRLTDSIGRVLPIAALLQKKERGRWTRGRKEKTDHGGGGFGCASPDRTDLLYLSMAIFLSFDFALIRVGTADSGAELDSVVVDGSSR